MYKKINILAIVNYAHTVANCRGVAFSKRNWEEEIALNHHILNKAHCNGGGIRGGEEFKSYGESRLAGRGWIKCIFAQIRGGWGGGNRGSV